MNIITGKDLADEVTSTKESPFRILLVEDNPGDVLIIRELLKESGIVFTLSNVSTLKETLLISMEREFDVIFLDLGLPDSVGVETLKKLQLFRQISPVVVMTGLDDEDVALESLRQGAQDYLVKNRLTSDNIVRALKYGIERKRITELLKKNARQFSLLSLTTAAINECEESSDILAVTCQNVNLLIKDSGVVVFGSEETQVHISGMDKFESNYDEIKETTGINFGQSPVHWRLKKSISEVFRDGKLHLVNHDSTGHPGKPDILIYGIGFLKRENSYGGALIFSRYPIGSDDTSIIETIGSQVSLSLQRKIIEHDLKESENRYRKLSRELEMKVRERTRDLENSNYHLNQELIERHTAEEALKKSESRLIELNATKDKFFNIIAHDLKNPFTCMLGSTELLLERFENMNTEAIKELAQVLNDSAKSGFAILQNLLDWSRSQTGMITFSPEFLNLKSLVDENIAELRLASARKEIDLNSEIDEDMTIFADKNMLNTILRNLVSNALKFTPRYGTVRIGAVINAGEVSISVKDTGIGIPEESMGELFRIDTNYTRPGTSLEQGTGLGLKLCKEFVELQGGKIHVTSKVKKGSEFIITLPARDN
ncbi:MAG: ATP-binding protein [Bacteroidota bacterium]|nr:ATP-binding protein [Bacteroidota bacterium]